MVYCERQKWQVIKLGTKDYKSACVIKLSVSISYIKYEVPFLNMTCHYKGFHRLFLYCEVF